MTDNDLLKRVAVDSAVMVGQPVIRGTRLTVTFILGLLAHGQTTAQILQEYDGLEEADIQACLLFARESLGSATFVPLKAANG
jgi:uncharacterized protein (DUF433 family)